MTVAFQFLNICGDTRQVPTALTEGVTNLDNSSGMDDQNTAAVNGGPSFPKMCQDASDADKTVSYAVEICKCKKELLF